MKSLVIIAILVLAAVITSSSEASSGNNPRVYHLSDIHLDPAFGTECASVAQCRPSTTPKSGKPGCDSSLEMARGSVEAVARQIVTDNADPALVLYTGDFYRHSFPEGANCTKMGLAGLAKRIIDDIVPLFGKFLDERVQFHDDEKINNTNNKKKKRSITHVHAPLISPEANNIKLAGVSSGNEDHFCDYCDNVSDLHQFSFVHFARAFEKQNILNSSQAALFSKFGYTSRFASGFSSPRLRVISLNTLIWASNVHPSIPSNEKDPAGQFAFLERELKSASEQQGAEKVFILSHIPPIVALWRSDFQSRFFSLLQQYNDIISLVAFGHTHRFAYLSAAKGAATMPPIFIGGPVTRSSRTTPDFGIYTLDPNSLKPTDFHQVSIVAEEEEKDESDNNNKKKKKKKIIKMNEQEEISVNPISPSSWIKGPSFKESMQLSDISSNAELYSLAHSMRYNSSFDSTFQKYWKFHQGGRAVEKCDTSICKRTWTCMLYVTNVIEAGICEL